MTVPSIGIGVPVWQGAAFVGETLECLLAQRGVAVTLFVSIDGPDAESERACRAFATDPRVRLVVQPQRLGWVRNAAAVFAGAAAFGAPFVCLHPHDDLASPDYLATLAAVAAERPEVAVVYSDIAAFGDWDATIAQPSVEGTPLMRQLTLLTQHFNAVAYRGLTRASALAQVPPLNGNVCDDFACDTVWMARLARAGELVRVPLALYRKRFHSASAHVQWWQWEASAKIEAWLQHCLDMLAEALPVCADDAERGRVAAAARARLVERSEIGPFATEVWQLGEAERHLLQQRFDRICAERFALRAG